MSKIRFRKRVSLPGLLSTVRTVFARISDPVTPRRFSLEDCLMSGLAVFHLKSPSLLHFDQRVRGQTARPATVHNLRTLFGVAQAPSDTCLRERLDLVNPARFLRKAFKAVFANLQRSKALEHFTVLDGHYLLSLDGTGYYSSKKVRCSSCCEKHHRNGTTTYAHQMLAGALVHPDTNIVIPLAPEMVTRRDGTNKNDCERNASKRFITEFRKDHPHLRTIVVEDALASNGPHIEHLRDNNLRFILGVKPDGNRFLFDWVKSHPDVKTHTRTERTGKGIVTHQFRWWENVPLNEARFDLEVNVIHYTETRPDGKSTKTTHWTWITDLPLSKTRMMPMMRAARARWRIENETIQTLKKSTLGYNLEHNFGHGKHHLSSMMACLCMLMFLMEQVAQLCCPAFRKALKRQVRKIYLWEEMRMLFSLVCFDNWEGLYRILAEPHKAVAVKDILPGEP